MRLLLLVILAVWIKRYFTSLFLGRSNPLDEPALTGVPDQAPGVSVVIAARDEQESIERCLRSLTNQSYPNYEIVVADDRSTDSTGVIVKSGFPSVNYFEIQSLPDGSAGKAHALSLAVERAGGEWLLFTDADTAHSRDSILIPLNFAMRNNIQMISLLPHPVCVGFWEKVIHPVAGLLLFILFPLEKVNRKGSRVSFGCGQYILVRRETYELIGGHRAVLSHPLEDIAMARNAKRAGVNYALMYAGKLIECRMYESFRELWNGWERIFYFTFRDRPWVLPIIAALIFLLSIFPYMALFVFPYIACAQLLLMHLAAERAYRFLDLDRRFIFTHVIGCAILSCVTVSAFVKRIMRMGITWKGRSYTATG